jgi:tRNA pseudouridine55 synthase
VTGGRRARSGSPGREIDALLVLDKPRGLTSNAALQRAKRVYRARKAGHTGSLDPLATGMLPLCFGRATRLSAYLLGAEKRYVVEAALGTRTDTGDAEGNDVEARPVPALRRTRVEETLARFRGEIWQTPPMYSALKHKGQRLYELARRGVEVERPARPVSIKALNLLELGRDRLVLEVRCSKGTYVRTLVEDIAEALATVGHVSALRRLAVGALKPGQMVELGTLEEARPDELQRFLLPADHVVGHLPMLTLPRHIAAAWTSGRGVTPPEAAPAGWMRLYAECGEFLGVGEADQDGLIKPRRVWRRPEELPGAQAAFDRDLLNGAGGR